MSGTVVQRDLDVYSVFAADGRANEITIDQIVSPTGTRLLVVADTGDLVIPGDGYEAVSDNEVNCVLSSGPQLEIDTGCSATAATTHSTADPARTSWTAATAPTRSRPPTPPTTGPT